MKLLEELVITRKMQEDAFFVFEAGHARSNATYPLALGIYKQNGEEEVLFPWEMCEEVLKQAKVLNDYLFGEYLKTL